MLILLRTGALMATLPFLGSRNIPSLAKAGLTFSVSILLFPVTKIDPAALPGNLLGVILLCLGELMIGAILGFTVRMLLTSVQIMGQLIGFQMGFAVANVLDPISGGQVSVLAQFAYLMTLLAMFSINGHYYFFTALADSFKLVPPGGFGVSQSLFQQITQNGSKMFSLAIRLGAPVIGALMFTQVTMGILAKTVPQMNILIVGFPITISVGLLFLALTMGIIIPLMVENFGNLGPTFVGLLKAM